MLEILVESVMFALRVAVLSLLSLMAIPAGSVADAESSVPSTRIQANDNQRAAGTTEAGTLTLSLRAGVGRWQPEGPSGPTLDVEAFGEVGRPLTVPAPMIRVIEGTEIVGSIRNDLQHTLTVHGLCARDGSPCAPLQVPPQELREVRFRSGRPGTYHYWASTLGAPVPFREMAGAFVVDAADAVPAPDRVIVITEWTNLTGEQLGRIMSADEPTKAFVGFKPRLTFVMNGLSWPATERFTYDVGERVRWRVINLSSQPHPLHLHGFYFDVDSLGDGLRDTVFADGKRLRVVTQLLPPAGTMVMTWTPERAGNWLFHCHVMHHVSLDRRLAPAQDATHTHSHDANAHHDKAAGMAGMVIGVTVRDASAPSTEPAKATPSQRLTLTMQPSAEGDGAAGFILREDGQPADASPPMAPGPAIVLRRGEPVEITLVNQLADATSIHWHGIELDSYYDGVHGFSGDSRRRTPMIAPGERFVVRFTPPRAGTFIYHTHLHDYRQLSSGLYGPIVVTEEGETFDPATDHVIVIGRQGLSSDEPSILTEPDSVVVNGQRAPRLVLNAGTRHRVRLINITPDDIFSVSVQSAEGPISWTPVAKDGAPVAAAMAEEKPARQTIAVGETYDFVFDAPRSRKTMWLEVRTPNGKWQAQGHIIVK